MRATALAVCAASALAQGAWTLVFEDDFNGPALNASNWNVKVNETHCEPCEPQLYIPSRVAVSNGTLIITTARDNVVGPGGERFNFSSGWIDTRGKFSAQYGRFEARVMLPAVAATGIWPAFWTLPTTDGEDAAGAQRTLLVHPPALWALHPAVGTLLSLASSLSLATNSCRLLADARRD